MRRWMLALTFCRFAESAFERDEHYSATMNAFAAVEQAIMALAEARGEPPKPSHRARMSYLSRLANEGVVPRDLLRIYGRLMEMRNDAEYEGVDGERAGLAIEMMCRFLEVVARVLGAEVEGCCGR